MGNEKLYSPTIAPPAIDRQFIKHAGRYSDEGAYNCNTDKLDWRKIKVECPYCRKASAPMLSKKTRLEGRGWEWVGDSHQEPYGEYRTTCSCGESYGFRLFTPQ
jgi:hypothetical protein